MEAYYAILHMQEFVNDQRQLLLPENLQNWDRDLANASNDELREDLLASSGPFLQ
jgi:hypothetical protein